MQLLDDVIMGTIILSNMFWRERCVIWIFIKTSIQLAWFGIVTYNIYLYKSLTVLLIQKGQGIRRKQFFSLISASHQPSSNNKTTYL